MGAVLTTASAVTCPSQGRVATTGHARLTVDGSPVLALDGIVGKEVAGCTVPTASGTTTCTSVLSASGTAAKLRVDGQAVALAALTGATNGSTPKVSASAGQSLLTAV